MFFVHLVVLFGCFVAVFLRFVLGLFVVTEFSRSLRSFFYSSLVIWLFFWLFGYLAACLTCGPSTPVGPPVIRPYWGTVLGFHSVVFVDVL